MIEVSNELKDTMHYRYSKPITFIVTDGVDQITAQDDLKLVEIKNTGNLCRSVMRQADIEHFGSHNYLEKYVQLSLGVGILQGINFGTVSINVGTSVITLNNHGLSSGEDVAFTTTGILPNEIEPAKHYYVIVIDENTFYLAENYQDAVTEMHMTLTGSSTGVTTLFVYNAESTIDTEYIDYGSFKVVNQTTTKGSDVIKLVAYDKMYESLQKYDLSPSYPMTLLEFLQAICARFDWTLATTSFPNSDLVIEEELFSNLDLPFRNILDQIAEASGSIIQFNNNDELVVRQITDEVLETLDAGNLNNLDLEEPYGPIASVVLSRQPQGDDIIQSI